MLISKFSKLLGVLDMIELPEIMAEELNKDELSRQHVTNVVYL